jgi:polyhydroxyalkanoate synthesis regulator phasin
MRDEIRRMALFTSGVAELTRYRAEELVKELVKAGEVGREQGSGIVKELLERSRANRRELVALIRSEINHQIESLGLATKRDVQRLERRVVRLEDRSKTAARKPPAGKTAARKPPAGKTAARKRSAAKTPAARSRGAGKTAGKTTRRPPRPEA